MKGLEVEKGVKYQPIVLIDYVSMAKGRSKGYGSKTNDIGDFLQTFKQFANVNKVTGVFLAQVLRTAEGEPNLSHILDSANYENNSDNAIILYRPEADLLREIRDPMTDQMVDSRNRFMFRVLKARDGQAQDILGHCDIKHFRFWHRHHQWGYDYTKLYENEEFWKQQYGL
jgi:Replicative DNA helicase